MNMLKMCLNWKVIAGLAAVGVGIYLVAPELAAALPILVLAVCTISMILMMAAMQGGQEGSRRASWEIDAPGPAHEEQIVRLRDREAALAEQIDVVEHEEPQPNRRWQRTVVRR